VWSVMTSTAGMRWAEHVARMRRQRISSLFEGLKERDCLEEHDVNGKVITN
jgi:hypothetical protein